MTANAVILHLIGVSTLINIKRSLAPLKQVLKLFNIINIRHSDWLEDIEERDGISKCAFILEISTNI